MYVNVYIHSLEGSPGVPYDYRDYELNPSVEGNDLDFLHVFSEFIPSKSLRNFHLRHWRERKLRDWAVKKWGPLFFFRVRDEILPMYILGLFHTMNRGCLLNNQDSMESMTVFFRGSNVLQVFWWWWKYMGRRNWSMNTCRICSGKRTSCEVCVCVCFLLFFVFQQQNWLVVSNMLIFTPTWGRFPIWLSNIFQMGWKLEPPTRKYHQWMDDHACFNDKSISHERCSQGRTDHDFLRGFHERYHRRSRRSGVNHQSA